MTQERPYGIRTMDLTPTPEAYRALLRVIMDTGTAENRTWAEIEMQRIRNVQHWGKQEQTDAHHSD